MLIVSSKPDPNCLSPTSHQLIKLIETSRLARASADSYSRQGEMIAKMRQPETMDVSLTEPGSQRPL